MQEIEKEMEQDRQMSQIMAYKVEDFDFYLKVRFILCLPRIITNIDRKKILSISKHHLISLTKMTAER